MLMNSFDLLSSIKQQLYQLGTEISETVRRLNDVYFKLESRKD